MTLFILFPILEYEVDSIVSPKRKALENELTSPFGSRI